MSLDTAEVDGYDEHRCARPDCSVCGIFQCAGESDADWKARIREQWDAPAPKPEPVVVVKPPPPPRTTCQRGHPWTPPRCRICKREANNESRRQRRQGQRQEAVA